MPLTAMNATTSGMTLSSIGSFSTVLPIVATIIFIGLLLLILINERAINFLIRIVTLLKQTFGNFIYGLLAIGFIALLYYPIKKITSQSAETNFYIFKVIIIAISGYIIISCIGWIAKTVVLKIIKRWKKHAKN